MNTAGRSGPGTYDRDLAILRRILPAAVASRLAATGSESLLAAHRREIAVLFADLRGFTAFTETAEPEEVVALLREFHGVVSELVERYEASVGDFAGDGVMLYFNDPLVVDDAAPRAIQTALDLRERFAAIGRRWTQRGYDLDVGVGIAVGYATLGLLGPAPMIDYKPVGTVVNMAARLCADARAGEVLVTHRVLADAGEGVVSEPGGDLTLKGLHRPIRAFRVLALRRPVDIERSVTTTAFVGRAEQMRHLEAALVDASQSTGRLVLLSGEPGIGKTRLTEELIRRAAQADATVAWGRCSERQGAPAFWPWAQAIEKLAVAVGPAALERALGRSGGVIAQVVPALAELRPNLELPPPTDPEAARFRLYEAITQFLRRVAERRPLVLVFDDLHWADSASLNVLGHVAAGIRDAAILVIGTYRDVDPPVGPPLSDLLAELTRERVTSRLALSGLDHDEVLQLILGTTGRQPDEALVARVRDRTEGNPFFVGELVRLLTSDEDDAVLAIEVPVAVRDVIRRRLARLPERTGHALRCAAVVGREVSLDVLARVCDLRPEEALEVLEPAVEARMLTRTPGSVATYRFSHALVNQTLYEEIGPTPRARLHLRVGEVLEERADGDSHLAEVASHFSMAVPAGPADKAFSYALKASGWAQERLGYEQAEDQLARAIELARQMEPPQRAACELEAQMRLVVLFMTMKGYGSQEVGGALARARELAQQLGNSGQVAAALWGLCAFNLEVADFQTAEGIGRELAQAGEQSGDAIMTMTGAWALGLVAFNRGRLDEAAEQLRRAATMADTLQDRSLAEQFSQHPPATCRAFLALVLWLKGDHEAAQRALAEGADRANEVGHTFSLANVRVFEATIGAFADDPVAAARAATDTIALSEGPGFRLYHAAAMIVRGWAVARQGDVVSGRQELETGLAQSEEIGSTMLHHFFLGLRADVQRMAGQRAEALVTVEEALRECDAVGGRFWEPYLRRTHAELLRLQAADRA